MLKQYLEDTTKENATANGYCQEIKIEELKPMLEEERKQNKWYRRFIKWLRGTK